MTTLSVRTTHHDDYSVLALNGELDMTSTSSLLSAVDEVLASGRRRLVVDAGGLTFCDSHGLDTLVKAQQKVVRADGTMELTHVHGVLRRVLEITKLARAFTIRPDRADGRRLPDIARFLRFTRWH
ncbi:anti-sigma factor antagonist [Microtetraspora sp. NBRC 13810]|uniref:STAS domain-containing protein n=1 Tax=Microtetraspora sp. NBRC 13810 TaxID=3030990 RepID=UPI0024A329CB|nr:STAS domain-containing protein [Microtetraspora sp. NBRC 13810]GLW08153.1 anti-sigma factor antagonist [Microtetraspora sp. NBRC 13810]